MPAFESTPLRTSAAVTITLRFIAVLAPDFKPLGFRMSLRDCCQAGSKPPF
jgi:hypothetical protein